MNALEIASLSLLGLYALDRAIKAALIARFFTRPAPVEPAVWPPVALLQPVTRGATNLAEHLAARAALDYPGPLRHIVICDAEDAASQAICRTMLPSAEIVLAAPDPPGAPVASKVAKMTAGVQHLSEDANEIVCFVDDDIGLPPHAMRLLVAHLSTPNAGAVFGLACQSSWNNPWESLMSGFVDANALTSYVPITFLTEPYTVTGHLFALRNETFRAGGGMDGMSGRFDDDHEIARRVRALGLRCMQTPLVYTVENALPTARAYRIQMRRWFVIPKQSMVPYLTLGENAATTLFSLGNLLPSALLILALVHPTQIMLPSAALAFLVFAAVYGWSEARYLPARTPVGRWPLLPVVCYITPLHVLLSLLIPGDRIEWRGQTYRAHRGGALEVVSE